MFQRHPQNVRVDLKACRNNNVTLRDNIMKLTLIHIFISL